MIRQLSSTSTDEQHGIDSEDAFQKMGIELPSHLNTYTRRWASLLLIAGSGAFASGPFAAWPTLEPLLIAEGVWAGPNQSANLASVYSIATGLAMISSLISGILYDAIGPRALGALSAFAVVFCLFGMAVAIKIPSLNNLLWIAYPAANVFGYANSWDVSAWFWLLPEDQNTVAAFIGAIQCLSDSFCLVAVFLHDSYGLQLPFYFILIGFLSMIAGGLALVYIPSHQEMKRIAQAVAIYQAAPKTPDSSYGATSDYQIHVPLPDSNDPDEQSVFSKSWAAVKDTCNLYRKVHPGISCLFFVWSMTQYMFVMYPMFEMYPLYVDLVGTMKAISLVNIFGGLYACIGAACLMVFGRIVDKLGMVLCVALLNLPTVVNAILYTVPKFNVQVAAQVLLTFLANVWYVFQPRFCLAYGPPELFGTMYGLLACLLGVGQIVLTRFDNLVGKLISQYLVPGHGDAAFSYTATIDMWCIFNLLASVALLCWWWYYPLPENGSTTLLHVKDADIDSDTAGETLSLLPKPLSVEESSESTSGTSCCGFVQFLGRRHERKDASGMP